MKSIVTFAIETSCDETSVAILRDSKILSMQTHSQIDLHKQFGGVVPEIAARSHLEKLSYLTDLCIKQASINPFDIDYVSVTNSPGLINGLLVGISFAKGLAISLNKPLKLINHLDGHIFTHCIEDKADSGSQFKTTQNNNFYCLLISGGHCQILKVNNINDKNILGQTIDDSVGEAFDKISKKLNLGYPGGPIIEKLAKFGNSSVYQFKIPMKNKNDFDFSFSGLKTFIINIINQEKNLPSPNEIMNYLENPLKSHEKFSFVCNLCASFQDIISNILIDRVFNVISADNFRYDNLVICGGVAANKYIYNKFVDVFCNESRQIKTKYPIPKKIKIITSPLYLCTDNAAMIGIANFIKIQQELQKV